MKDGYWHFFIVWAMIVLKCLHSSGLSSRYSWRKRPTAQRNIGCDWYFSEDTDQLRHFIQIRTQRHEWMAAEVSPQVKIMLTKWYSLVDWSRSNLTCYHSHLVRSNCRSRAFLSRKSHRYTTDNKQIRTWGWFMLSWALIITSSWMIGLEAN